MGWTVEKLRAYKNLKNIGPKLPQQTGQQPQQPALTNSTDYVSKTKSQQPAPPRTNFIDYMNKIIPQQPTQPTQQPAQLNPTDYISQMKNKELTQNVSNVAPTQTRIGYFVNENGTIGIPKLNPKNPRESTYDNRPLQIIGETPDAYYYLQDDGSAKPINKFQVVLDRIPSQEEIPQIIQNAQIQQQQYSQQYRKEQFDKLNPVDQFFTKATNIGLRGDYADPSLGGPTIPSQVPLIGGAPLLDVGAGVVGTVASFGTPTGGGQSLGGATMQVGNTVDDLFRMGGQKFLNKLPNAGQKIVRRTARGIAEEIPYSIMQGIEQSPEEFAKSNVQNAAVGAVIENVLGATGDVFKGVKRAADKAKINKQIKNVDAKMKYYDDNGILPKTKQPKAKISNSTDSDKLFAINQQLRPKLKSPVNEDVKIVDDVNVVNSKDIKPKTNLSKIEKIYTQLVDNQYAVNKFSKEAGSETSKTLASNSRNAQGTVSYILKDALVDKAGNKIGGSFKEIIDRIPKSQELDFNKYILHRHNVSRMKVDKPVFGKTVTADNSLKKISEYEAKYTEFKKTAEMYDKFMNNFMEEWGVKSGLIKEDVWKSLKEKYPNYVPTYRLLNEVTGSKSLRTKQGFVNIPNQIKKATGSDKPVINPLEKSMELIDKTVKASKYNEVGQSIVNELRKKPEKLKSWAEIVEDPGEDIAKMADDVNIEDAISKFNEQFDITVKKPKLNGADIVKVMENGKPVYIKVNDRDFFDAITGLLVPSLGKAEKAGRAITRPFKSLITTKNPIFAFRNIFRDIPTAYINGSENNPVKFMYDLIDASKDMTQNSEMFQIYKALGGGEANFFKNDLNKLYKEGLPAVRNIEKFNNFFESIPRYAEYKRTVLKGGNTFASKMKGLYNANEVTTNFARQGNVTKAFDAWIPYLNASFQGLDKLIRQVKNNPVKTLSKGIVAVTVPAVALHFVNKDNPYYNDLSNRTKDNYYLIPNPTDKDNKGYSKTFIKIPKSREYGVMLATLFERSYRAYRGKKTAFRGFGNTVANNFIPSMDTIAQPILNLKSNKDFADRDIVPRALQGRSPRYQYDDQTTEISKFFGDKFNVSPKQLDYLMRSYTGVLGQIGVPATTKSSYDGDVRKNLTNPITTQFTADPLYSNEAVSQFYDNKSLLDTANQDYKFTDKQSKDYNNSLRKKFNNYANDLSDLYKKLKVTKNQSEIESIRRQILEIAKLANKMFESSTK